MLIITDLRKRKLKIRYLGATLDKRMAVGLTFHPLIALTTLMFVWRCGIAQRRRAQIRRKRPRMWLGHTCSPRPDFPSTRGPCKNCLDTPTSARP